MTNNKDKYNLFGNLTPANLPLKSRAGPLVYSSAPAAESITPQAPLPNFESVSIRLPTVGGPLPVFTKVPPAKAQALLAPTLKPTLKIPVKSIKPVIPPAPEGDRRSRIKAFVNSFF